MKKGTPKPIYLEDYTKPNFLIPEISLTFHLHDENTRVISTLSLKRNHENKPLVLNGVNLNLLNIKLNGTDLPPSEYTVDEKTLTIPNPPEEFILEIENIINPKENTSLEGLYKSGDIFCTQNEPEGFRHITYFLDRSDVMSTYTTTIIADKKKYPTLLSNGNPIEQRQLENGNHLMTWHDPFPKPCYLFALVAGNLGSIQDTFKTKSGRMIDLRIYCDPGNESKCSHAMKSLIRSMKWDEETWGLEYDLDIFMIVAVDAFNFGAMENKGLNIFNTSCILADPESATDKNFEHVETVVAHEYFHNWTGNRVTCRDWFQLTLKEGLTVFRDQEYTSDMYSRGVKRIEDATILRQRQFLEDAGPTSHPIQPKSYIQINNFYTSTIYNKGAEVIRMLQTLIGKETFRKGLDKYFELYDGQAVTTEDFLHAMALASGSDLSQFSRWYHQAGTPEVSYSETYNTTTQTYSLEIIQNTPATADGSPKKPFSFPLTIGLIDAKGKDIPIKHSDHKNNSSGLVLNITNSKEEFTFKNISEKPALSINRHFSSPIKITTPRNNKEYFHLMAHDSDLFNRWDAGQEVAARILIEQVENKGNPTFDSEFMNSFGILLKDHSVDPLWKAVALTLPSETTLGQRQKIIDFDGTHQARQSLTHTLARKFEREFRDLYQELADDRTYAFDTESIGRRSLKNACLHYLANGEFEDSTAIAYDQYQKATNMTDTFTSLDKLAQLDCPERERALSHFYDRWEGDSLVLNKWFTVQAHSSLPTTLEKVRELGDHPRFEITLPNRVRALYKSFIYNHIHFHKKSGEGYALISDLILELDQINPHMAASLAEGFLCIQKLDEIRKNAMVHHIQHILAHPSLSTNTYEIVSKCLSKSS